jgi:peptidoglycan/xylan/chitin deacetylase (PgdA/CDA1 family)
MERSSVMRSVVLVELILSVLMLGLIVRGRIESATPAAETDVWRRGVPVLAYHYLRDGSGLERVVRSVGTVLLNLPLISETDYWTVSSAAFERHLRYLRDRGFRTIPPETLIAYMKGEKVLEGRCVMITFDDADESVYRIAYPLLKKYGMEGTVFVVTAHVGQSWSGLELATWDELKEMRESGIMEIGSHTHDLHYKVREGRTPYPLFAVIGRGAGRNEARRVLEDFRRSKLEIEQRTGETTLCLAWPFGFGSDLADSLVQVAGYTGAMTLRPGLNSPGDSPYHVKRFTVTAQTSFRAFQMMLSGSVAGAAATAQLKENN